MANQKNETNIVVGVDVEKSKTQISSDLQKALAELKKLKVDLTGWGILPKTSALISSSVKASVAELKSMDTVLTDIGRTSRLTASQLKGLGNTSFETASKYGKSASAYLAEVQKMYRAGYQNAKEMAELSTLAQAAGGMDSGMSNAYLTALDSAYQLKGNIKALNEVLDGQSSITSRNALSMSDLAAATKLAASQSADSKIAVSEMSAAMGTMMSVTRQGSEETAAAWNNILQTIGQASGALDGSMDEKALTKYEKVCSDLGVSLKTVRNGIAELRDPMEILKELSEAYNALDQTDVRRSNLTDAFGDKSTGNQLAALLENWSVYEKMLSQYSQGYGSAMEEAAKSANTWEGSITRLNNTWTDTMENFVDSDAVVFGINSLNELLNIINKITDAAGSFGSIGLAAGLYAGVKNIGKRMRVHALQIIVNCFEYAPHGQDAFKARSVPALSPGNVL